MKEPFNRVASIDNSNKWFHHNAFVEEKDDEFLLSFYQFLWEIRPVRVWFMGLVADTSGARLDKVVIIVYHSCRYANHPRY